MAENQRMYTSTQLCNAIRFQQKNTLSLPENKDIWEKAMIQSSKDGLDSFLFWLHTYNGLQMVRDEKMKSFEKNFILEQINLQNCFKNILRSLRGRLDISNFINKLKNQAEIATIYGISNYEDSGFMMLLLNNLAQLLEGKQELLDQYSLMKEIIFSLRQYEQQLDGRLFLAISKLGITDIEFWRELESIYLKEAINRDSMIQLIEGLVGLSLSNRGTSQLIFRIQDKIKGNLDSNFKIKDTIRLFFALGLLSDSRRDQQLLDIVLKSIQSIDLLSDFSKYKQIDLINILQSLVNLQIHSIQIADAQQGLLKLENIYFNNDKLILNLFELFAKMKKEIIDQNLLSRAIKAFEDDFHDYSDVQFAKIIVAMKGLNLNEQIAKIKEQVVNPERKIDSNKRLIMLEAF
ncbi:UNKNOWN [Stylonychia lemnae]|uniref:Uncharacterized protein n=1 Tax=Stylonychia lemnae TaxID=5949 RepID=A0A078ARN0_STYLE|nr:UNKNOWN [Stylonychia lemnae]|eukprot:CDW84636.1 UNKNOWN [Stylonychia lemnae]